VDIAVECHSGYRGNEKPRWLRLGGVAIEVAEIIDRWLDTDRRYFKLCSGGGGLYPIRHDERTGTWSPVFYDARGPEGSSHSPTRDST